MKKNHFEEFKKSVKQMKNIEKGVSKPSRVYKYPDVKKIRKKLHVSQKELSEQLGISNRTLQNWEQSRRAPTGPARVLLNLLELQPNLLYQASGHTSSRKLKLKGISCVKTTKARRRTKSKKVKVPAQK